MCTKLRLDHPKSHDLGQTIKLEWQSYRQSEVMKPRALKFSALVPGIVDTTHGEHEVWETFGCRDVRRVVRRVVRGKSSDRKESVRVEARSETDWFRRVQGDEVVDEENLDVWMCDRDHEQFQARPGRRRRGSRGRCGCAGWSSSPGRVKGGPESRGCAG